MKIQYQNIALLLIVILSSGLWLYSNRTIELYGDIFRLMIIPLIVIWIFQRQYAKLKELIYVSVGILTIAFVLKFSFSYLSSHYYESLYWILNIAKRPINGEFNGFPSGHTTIAFITAFFVWKYGEKKWSILVGLLAILVGLSRIISTWHTPLQVCAGAILGFAGSMLLLKTMQRFYLTHSRIQKDKN